MNNQAPLSKFCENIYSRFPMLDKVTTRINTSSLVIQQSYLRDVWVIAKKFQSIWNDTLGVIEDNEDYGFSRELYESFQGLFECLRYVFSATVHRDSRDLLKGMTIILPFLADEIIVPSEGYQNKLQWNIYHTMFSNGIKAFIIECCQSLPQDEKRIEIMMQQIFGDDYYYDKYRTICYVFDYVKSLPDHFVPYPYDLEDDE